MDFLTRVQELTLRHSAYDKPTNKQLQDIGIIEYFWQDFFDKAIAQSYWGKPASDLKNIIQERCVDNFERRHTLNLLNQSINCLQDFDEDYQTLIILLEGIKDWARKSVVRGEDIK